MVIFIYNNSIPSRSQRSCVVNVLARFEVGFCQQITPEFPEGRGAVKLLGVAPGSRQAVRHPIRGPGFYGELYSTDQFTHDKCIYERSPSIFHAAGEASRLAM